MPGTYEHLCAAILGRLSTVVADAALEHPFRHLCHSLRSATAKAAWDCAASPAYAALLSKSIHATSAAELDPIASALDTLALPLPWVYHYEPRADAPALARDVAFAELIGPDGPMTAPACRVGFTLMAPNTLYPLHAHPAVELYYVIAGHAEWQTDCAKSVPPGQLVLHRSNQAHAMRTSREPLLALWSWSGDLASPAFYL